MYHVLVFQQGGKYILDGPPEQQEEGGGMAAPVQFDSLDELILFLTGHNLKVGEDEVQLTEICPCEEESARKSSNCKRERIIIITSVEPLKSSQA